MIALSVIRATICLNGHGWLESSRRDVQAPAQIKQHRQLLGVLCNEFIPLALQVTDARGHLVANFRQHLDAIACGGVDEPLIEGSAFTSSLEGQLLLQRLNALFKIAVSWL
ncbi:hypothetical protein [Stenotrophomonas muris]|uniref:hypothetical protein n=1 Tax=Stenotrophomonas muris TaxID=2963283 RepID=UPI00383AB7A4